MKQQGLKNQTCQTKHTNFTFGTREQFMIKHDHIDQQQNVWPILTAGKFHQSNWGCVNTPSACGVKAQLICCFEWKKSTKKASANLKCQQKLTVMARLQRHLTRQNKLRFNSQSSLFISRCIEEISCFKLKRSPLPKAG